MSTQARFTETITPPRTRWAAIIWGVLFAAVAASSLWLVADDERRAGIADWTLTLTPTTVSALMILTVGVLLLVAGSAALLRRGQRRSRAVAEHERSDDPLAEGPLAETPVRSWGTTSDE